MRAGQPFCYEAVWDSPPEGCAFEAVTPLDRRCAMNATLQTQLSIAALACSVLALFISLLAAFPGLKVILAAVRDGVLWFALFLVLGGVSFIVWQQLQKLPKPPASAAASARLPP